MPGDQKAGLGGQFELAVGQAAGLVEASKTGFEAAFDRMAVESRRLGVRIIRIGEERAFLDELQQGAGDYQEEPEIQCGIFCEMAEKEIAA